MRHSAGFRWGMQLAWNGLKELHFLLHVVAMAVVVDVTLFSGQTVSLKADLTASVQGLAEHARRELGVGRGRLFTSSGNALDGNMKLGAAKFKQATV